MADVFRVVVVGMVLGAAWVSLFHQPRQARADDPPNCCIWVNGKCEDSSDGIPDDP